MQQLYLPGSSKSWHNTWGKTKTPKNDMKSAGNPTLKIEPFP
jgi:hypothetical protein